MKLRATGTDDVLPGVLSTKRDLSGETPLAVEAKRAATEPASSSGHHPATPFSNAQLRAALLHEGLTLPEPMRLETTPSAPQPSSQPPQPPPVPPLLPRAQADHAADQGACRSALGGQPQVWRR